MKNCSAWPLFLLRSFLLIFAVGFWDFLLDGNAGYKHLHECQISINSWLYTLSNIEDGQGWVAWSNLWQKSKIYNKFKISTSLIIWRLYLSTILESWWLFSRSITAFGSSLKVEDKKVNLYVISTYLSNFNKKEEIIKPVRDVIQNLNWSLVSIKRWKEAVQMVWKETQPMDPPSWSRQDVIVL